MEHSFFTSTRVRNIEFYDKQGKRIGFLEWKRLFNDTEYAIIKSTLLGEHYQITTQWIGTNVSDYSPPLIFKTEAHGRMRRFIEFSHTRQEALKRHERMIEELRGF